MKTTTKDKADDELNSFQANMKADAEAIGEERGKSSALPTVIDPKYEPLSKKIPGSDPTLVGGTKDAHGCLAAAGMSWCAVLSKCIRPYEIKCVAPPAAVALAPAAPAAVSAAVSGGCVNAVGEPVPANLCKAPPAPARAWVTKGTLTFTGLPQDTEITAAMESTLKTVLSKKCGATPTQIEIIQEDKIVEAPSPSSSGGSGDGSSSTEASLLDALTKDPTAVKTDDSESPPEVTTEAAVALLEEAVVGGRGGQGEPAGLVVAYVIQSSSEAKAASERSAMETLRKGGAATLGPLLEEIKKGSSVESSFAKASSVAVNVEKDSGSSGSSGSGSSAAGSGVSAIGSGSSAISGSSGSGGSGTGSGGSGSGSGSGGVTGTSGAASTPKAVFVPKVAEAGNPLPKATDYSSSILSVSPEEVRLQLYCVCACACVRVCVCRFA